MPLVKISRTCLRHGEIRQVLCRTIVRFVAQPIAAFATGGPPIVSEELWNAANTIIAERRRSRAPAPKRAVQVFGGLVIAQGKLAAPDYRDYLADLIEARYGSRYRFCKETGVDPGHLSRVFASRSELSLQNLQRILDALHAALVIQPGEDLAEQVSPERGARDLAVLL